MIQKVYCVTNTCFPNFHSSRYVKRGMGDNISHPSLSDLNPRGRIISLSRLSFPCWGLRCLPLSLPTLDALLRWGRPVSATEACLYGPCLTSAPEATFANLGAGSPGTTVFYIFVSKAGMTGPLPSGCTLRSLNSPAASKLYNKSTSSNIYIYIF